MLDSLNSAGFNNEYLKRNLIGFCSDGASVMLGRNFGNSQMLLDAIIKNMKKRLVADDHVKATYKHRPRKLA